MEQECPLFLSPEGSLLGEKKSDSDCIRFNGAVEMRSVL